MKSLLPTMTLDQLNRIKKRWYDSAVSGPDCIVSCLTRLTLARGEQKDHSYPKYVLTFDNIELYLDTYGHYFTVKVGGRLRLSTHNEKLFVPGDWLEKLLPLMEETRLQEEHEKIQKIEAERLSLLDLLGDD